MQKSSLASKSAGNRCLTAGSLSVFLVVFVFTISVRAQPTEFQESQEAVALGFAAYEAKDYETSLSRFEHALSLRPNHPGLMYNIAAVSALSGNPLRAVDLLNRLADMKVRFPADKDPDFKSVSDGSDFKRVLQRFESLTEEVGTPVVVLRLQEKDLLTEGVAFDPKTESFFISSVHKSKVVQILPDGTVEDFLHEGQNGLWAILGIKADLRRRSLYVSSSAVEQMRNFKLEDTGRAGIFQFDIDLRTLTRSYLLSNEKAQHVIGDLIIHSNGDIYASDSKYNAIYLIRPAIGVPEEFVSPGTFASLQGLTFSDDEETLFVADYSRGLFRIDMDSGEIDEIAHADTICTLGIDGLYFHKGRLIATQNGIRPHRVVDLALNANHNKIARATILAANHPAMDDPTLGTIIGEEFFFVANSQWGAFGDDGKVRPEAQLQEAVVLKVRL